MQKQWEVGKTYKLVDVKGFISKSENSNTRIVENLKLFDYTITVKRVECGAVMETDIFTEKSLGLLTVFNPSEIIYFEEVSNKVIPTKDPVAEWLDKACYVYTKDDSIESFVLWDEVKIVTDHGDILGSKQVVEFINNRYDLLHTEAKVLKKVELENRKAKLLEELEMMKKELEGL